MRHQTHRTGRFSSPIKVIRIFDPFGSTARVRSAVVSLGEPDALSFHRREARRACARRIRYAPTTSPGKKTWPCTSQRATLVCSCPRPRASAATDISTDRYWSRHSATTAMHSSNREGRPPGLRHRGAVRRACGERFGRRRSGAGDRARRVQRDRAGRAARLWLAPSIRRPGASRRARFRRDGSARRRR